MLLSPSHALFFLCIIPISGSERTSPAVPPSDLGEASEAARAAVDEYHCPLCLP